MFTFLWVLYIALMLSGAIFLIVFILNNLARIFSLTKNDIAIIVIFTIVCISWLGFIIYYLN
jgi:hypothetical protein